MISNLRQLDLNLLLVFDALMQEQNLSRAALRLHMSQSTVSNALARLREQLGEPLFKRTARGMVPTTQAHLIHGPIRQALLLLQTGLSQQDALDPSAELSFRLSMNDYALAVFFPHLFAQLKSLAPRLVLSVQRDDAEFIPRQLAFGELDLAIDYLHFDDPDLRYQALRQEQLVVIARPAHPICGDGLTLERYQACQHIAVLPRSGRGSPLEIVLGSARVHRQIQLHVPDYLPIPAIVAQSDLLGTVPRALAQFFAPIYALQIFPPPLEIPPIQVNLIWHRQQDMAPGLRWLREQITRVVHEHEHEHEQRDDVDHQT
jgi:DNA-binding transcriptional LysR family regulator